VRFEDAANKIETNDAKVKNIIKDLWSKYDMEGNGYLNK